MVGWEENKKESLLRQLDLVAILRDRNRNWATKSDDAETAKLHGEIADLFAQTLEHYNSLLDAYQKPANDVTVEG